MASPTIAGARGAGKSALARADILRDAHRRTRWQRARAFYPDSYRDTFPGCLRAAWSAAKEKAAYDARMAVLAAEEEAAFIPLPDDVARQVSGIRFEAECQTLTSYGNRRRRELLAEADDLAAAARCAIITNGDTHRHAHAR